MGHQYTFDDLPNLEKAFLEAGDSTDNYGWSPLPLSIFSRLMDAATVNVVPNTFFLEAGSGIGTKLFIAREKYGLFEYGVEQNQYMVSFAKNELCVRCYVGDVIQVPYDMASIVYISRPFKDDQEEIKYEKSVHAQMRTGSILIAAWAAVKPSWPILYREGQHGVWRKPQPGEFATRLVPDEHPNTIGEYRNMIARQEGSDPLIRKPGPMK
jgi:hypothetical protein